MSNNIFDLFDTSDLPEDVLSEVQMGRTEEIITLLKHANRPLTLREISVGMYRKFGVTYTNSATLSTAMRSVEKVYTNLIKTKEGTTLKYFYIEKSGASQNVDELNIETILNALSFAKEPVSINELTICIYRLHNIAASKKMISYKIEAERKKPSSRIVKEGVGYILKNNTRAIDSYDESMFYLAYLYQADNKFLKSELNAHLNNGQYAIMELLKRYESLSSDEIINLLATEYGMIKDRDYLEKALSSLTKRQCKNIVKVENKYKLER